ncbi:MAG: hypothetical protein IT324_19160 [Anaerolineae bacterium]|nr:hypothetical protein [Anaerolineae bacterium]
MRSRLAKPMINVLPMTDPSSTTRSARRVLRFRGWLLAASGGVLVIVLVTAVTFTSGVLPLPAFLQKQPAPYPTAAPTRDERWRQDIQYLAAQLPYLHVDPFTRTSRAAFEQVAAQLNTDVPSLTDQQIVMGMMRLVASLGDGHTQAIPHWSLGYRRYPIEPYWFNDGLYVLAASGPYRKALGAKIIQIGGTDPDQVYAAVKTLIPAENNAILRQAAPLYMVTPEILYGLGVVPTMDNALFEFQNTQGERFSLNLTPVGYDDRSMISIYNGLNVPRPLSEQNRAAYYWYQYLADTRAVYVQYNVCDNMKDKPFDQFARELFAFIDSHPIDRLIIDLRYNGGGNESVLDPFIDSVLARPDLNKKGNFFAIIGRGTFSSAMKNAITLRERSRVTLVGEATGGKPNHFGEIRNFKLPNSGLLIQYSTRHWRTVWGDDPLSLEPDTRINRTIDDVLTGRDPMLEAVLR